MTEPQTPTAAPPLVVGSAAPFPLKPTISAVRMAELQTVEPGMSVIDLTRRTIEQIGGCIANEKDRKRFEGLWENDDYTDQMLADAFRDVLNAHIQGRPTDGPSPSSGGSGTPATGEPSTPDSSSPGAADLTLSPTT